MTFLLIGLLNVQTENLLFVEIPDLDREKCIKLVHDYTKLHINGSIKILHISCEVPHERERIKEPSPENLQTNYAL